VLLSDTSLLFKFSKKSDKSSLQLYDITFLIDTHCSNEREKQWKTEWGYSAFFASLNSTSRGVAIMFINSFQYTLHSETRDPKGNFIILNVSTQEQRLSLVALYGSNEDSPDFWTMPSKASLLCVHFSPYIN
jgi:hypothetical protein